MDQPVLTSASYASNKNMVLKADPLLRWVPTSHLAFEVMGSGQPHYHFGTQGQLQMGEAFAAAYLRDIGKPLASTNRGFKNGLPIAKPARVRLFVMAGQRNMEGEDSYVSANRGAARLRILGEGTDRKCFVSLFARGRGESHHLDLGTIGAVDLSRQLRSRVELWRASNSEVARCGRRGLALVKFTHSGAQGPDWFPNGSAESNRNLYQELIRFIRSAQEDLQQQGYKCSIAGIFWHTGENDTYFGPYSQNNAKWMKQLIDQVRIDLQLPDLPWFISEQHKNAIVARLSIRLTPHSTNWLAPIRASRSSRRPTSASHDAHFGTKGTLLLGEEMADAYLKKQ